MSLTKVVLVYEGDVDLHDTKYVPVMGGEIKGFIDVMRSNKSTFAAMLFDADGQKAGWIETDTKLLLGLDGSGHSIVAAARWVHETKLPTGTRWDGIVCWKAKSCPEDEEMEDVDDDLEMGLWVKEEPILLN